MLSGKRSNRSCDRSDVPMVAVAPGQDTRAVLNGVLWVLGTGAQWRELPSRYPSYQTSHRRFQQWLREGRLERILRELTKELVLKGVFSRESLWLTSDDLGTQQFTDAAPIEPGQLRLLVLGHSFAGYAMSREAPSLDQAIPRLRDPNDELLATVKVLTCGQS
jgi:transposase